MNIERDIRHQFELSLGQYPVVTLVGPRQSGKTTLSKILCPDFPFINLEQPETRVIAAEDPRAIFNKYPDHLIIDEVQRVPEILSYIQAIVDEKQQDGMFVLTGSEQPELHQALSQSLAGRTAILELYPLSQHELQQANFNLLLNQQLLNGCYPRIYKKDLNPTQMYRDYVKTYLERDVRRMINLKDLTLFQRFIKLCAARTGCILNLSNLSNEVGVSHHTINHWISVLQASFLIRLLPPYFENFGKQVIKSPKLYFTDVGLAAYLLEIESLSQIDRDPLRGNLFETFVVMELMKTRLNRGLEPNLYYYRDAQQNEVDLIYKRGSELIPIEIKSSQTFQTSHLKGINYFRKLVGKRCGLSYLVYAGDQDFKMRDCHILPYRNIGNYAEDFT